MIGNNVYGGSGGSTEQLGIYPIGTDGRPTGNVTVPSGVTSLFYQIFQGNTFVTSVNLPNSVTSLGNYCFYGCSSLSSIIIPNSVTSLGSNCFYGCSSLSSIIIPTSVTSLGSNCFQDCTNLLSAIVSSNVASLSATFYRCNKLVETTLNRAVITFDTYVFYNCSAMTTLNTISGFNPTGLNLSSSNLLTVNSMVSMFNNLTTIGTTKTITLGATNLAKLTVEQKAIATGKGWTLA